MGKWSALLCREIRGMNMITVLLALSYLSVVLGQDPCSNYEDLGNPKRTTAHLLTDDDDAICDAHEVTDGTWYRFKQYNGAKMPESCQDMDRCGTVHPIWMDGTHPTDDGIKYVIAFAHAEESCRADAYNISVKRCVEEQGEYFVYQLKEPTYCPSAYCAGDGVWCQYHQYWDETSRTCKVRVPDVTTKTSPTGVTDEESEEVFTTAGPPSTATTPDVITVSRLLIISLNIMIALITWR